VKELELAWVAALAHWLEQAQVLLLERELVLLLGKVLVLWLGKELVLWLDLELMVWLEQAQELESDPELVLQLEKGWVVWLEQALVLELVEAQEPQSVLVPELELVEAQKDWWDCHPHCSHRIREYRMDIGFHFPPNS